MNRMGIRKCVSCIFEKNERIHLMRTVIHSFIESVLIHSNGKTVVHFCFLTNCCCCCFFIAILLPPLNAYTAAFINEYECLCEMTFINFRRERENDAVHGAKIELIKLIFSRRFLIVIFIYLRKKNNL